MALHFKTLVTRTLTAAVFVGVLMFCIIFHSITFQGLFFIVAVWGLWEFYRLMRNKVSAIQKIAGIFLGASLYLFSSIHIWKATHQDFPSEINYRLLITPILIFCLLTGFDLLKTKNFYSLAKTFLGILYVIIPFIILNFLAFGFYSNGTEINYSTHITLGLFFLLWINDSGAYLIGSSFGKHKLYEKISPGKTWEGTIGGAIVATGSSYLIWTLFPSIELNHWVVIAVIASVMGTIGDLLESKLKRRTGVKDSGAIMPGHGGILDRFDSLIFCVPFVYLYLFLFS